MISEFVVESASLRRIGCKLWNSILMTCVLIINKDSKKLSYRLENRASLCFRLVIILLFGI